MSSEAPDLHALARALGGEVSGRQVLAPGPGHSPRDRSLSVLVDADAPEGFVVYSHSGDDPLACRDHVRAAAGLPERYVVDRRRSPVRRSPMPAADPAPDPEALALWDGAHVEGELVGRYLAGRGIRSFPRSIRQTGVLRFGRTPMPAMIAGVQGPDRRLIAVQTTLLTWQGKKAPVSNPKTTTGRLGRGAVRLGKAGEVLGIAEGVETALSAQQLSDVPCWASLGCHRLAKLWIPPEVRELHIFADNDPAGRRDAEVAAAHFTRQGLAVRLRWPAAGFKDFNDALQAEAKDAA